MSDATTLPDGWTTNDDICRSLCMAAANNLIEAFVWSESLEGGDFWEDVHNRLVAIAAGRTL